MIDIHVICVFQFIKAKLGRVIQANTFKGKCIHGSALALDTLSLL